MRSVRNKTLGNGSCQRHPGSRLLVSAIMVLYLTITACEKKFTGKTHVFTCSDGTRVEVVYSEKRDYAMVRLGDKSYKLKQIPAASGAKYSDGKVVFWNKGRGAFIEIGGEVVYDGCHLVE
jgi:membrane-bound inhibitor of C-type lysozyme